MSISRTRKGIQHINNMQFTMDGWQQQLLQSETSTTINSVLRAAHHARARRARSTTRAERALDAGTR
jgi:hypothetical protein